MSVVVLSLIVFDLTTSKLNIFEFEFELNRNYGQTTAGFRKLRPCKPLIITTTSNQLNVNALSPLIN